MLLFVSGAFWGFSEYIYPGLQLLIESSKEMAFNSWVWEGANLNFIFLIPLGILFAIVWTFVKIPARLKLTGSLVITALGFSLVFIFLKGQESPVLLLLIYSMLIAFGEITFMPTINAIIARRTDPKILATIFGVLFLPSTLAVRLIQMLFDFEDPNPVPRVLAGIGAMALLAALMLVFHFVMKDEEIPQAPIPEAVPVKEWEDPFD